MHMLYASSSWWDYIVLYLEQIVLRITKQIDGEAAHYDPYVRFLLGIGLIVFSWFSRDGDSSLLFRAWRADCYSPVTFTTKALINTITSTAAAICCHLWLLRLHTRAQKRSKEHLQNQSINKGRWDDDGELHRAPGSVVKVNVTICRWLANMLACLIRLTLAEFEKMSVCLTTCSHSAVFALTVEMVSPHSAATICWLTW